MNIIFFGTANISKFFLENIDKKHKVVSVVTMCDKAVGRGNHIKSPAVKLYADENNIPCIQLDKFTDDIKEKIKKCNADAGVIVSFGKLIPEEVFNIPKYKCFNIHFSLLPMYRGASPVQQALIDGQKQTGVTAFFIEKGLDTGDIIIQEKLDIAPEDTSETLFEKLNNLGITVMNKAIDMLEQNNMSIKQEGIPSFCKIFTKENGRINWNKTSEEIYNLYRGLYLWPNIFCTIGSGKMSGKTIKITECLPVNDDILNCEPGTITSIKKGSGFTVKCGTGSLFITKVQPESKAKMPACDFLNGSQLKIKDKLN